MSGTAMRPAGARAAAWVAALALGPVSLGAEELLPKARLGLAELTPAVSRPKNAATGQVPQRVAKLLEEARRHIEARNFAGAVPLLERAVGYAPKDPTVRKMLGKAYLGLRNRGKAAAHLAAAVESAGDDLETHLLLGQLAAAERQSGKAILHLRTALECSQVRDGANPLAGEALLTLSLLLDREGYWTAALEGYSRLSKWIDRYDRSYAGRPALREWVLRSERLLARRGGLLLLLGRPAEALELLQRAYRRDRTNGRTARLLLDALLALKKYDQAEKTLLAMGAQPTQRADIPRLLAALAEKTRDEKLCERFWKAFRAEHDPDVDLAVGVAGVALKHRWADQAVGILRSVVAQRPADPQLWLTVCRGLAESNRYEELYDLAQRGLRADPNALGAVAQGIDRTAGLVEREGVERRFAEKARKDRSPQRHAMLYLAGRLAQGRGKHLLASDLFLQAAERPEPFFRAYEALLESYLAQKRPDRVDRLLARLDQLAARTHLPAYFRGKVALGRGEVKLAAEQLEKALAAKKDDLPTIKLLAEAYMLQPGRADEAVAVLQKGLDAHPGDVELTRKLFDIHLARRRFLDARKLAADLIQRDRQSIPGRLMMVELALAVDRQTDARRLLDQLVREAPDNADVQLLSVRLMLGRPPALISRKDFDEASERLRRLLRVEPDNARVRTVLAELLAAVDRYDEAAGLFSELFEEDPGSAAAVQQYVGALLRAGRKTAALRAVERFRERNDEDLWGRSRHIRLLAMVGRSAEARALGERWIRQTDDENLRSLYRQELLAALIGGNDDAETLAYVEKWIAERPSEERLRLLEALRVRLLVRLKRYDEANRRAEQLIQVEPFDGGSLVVSAAIEARQQAETPEILRHWMERIEQFVAQLEATVSAVKGLKKSGAETSGEYEKALKPLPPRLREQVARGVGSGGYDVVLSQLDRQIAQSRERIDELHGLYILSLGEAGRVDVAAEKAREWIRQAPRALRPKQILVSVLTQAKKYEQAQRFVEEWLAGARPTAAASRPVNLDATTQWLMETSVRLTLLRRQYRRAVELADRYLELDPNATELLVLKSGAMTELGRDDDAVAALEAAWARDPNDPGLNNNLGYIYAERGIHLEKAERLLKKARAAEPLEIAFADSEAWIYYKQGRFLEAGRAFQRLIVGRDDEEIEHGVILDHAGDAYYRLGWTDRAVELWKRALELAKKVERPTREERGVLERAARKIQAAADGRPAPVAPAVEPAGQTSAPPAAPPAGEAGD